MSCDANIAKIEAAKKEAEEAEYDAMVVASTDTIGYGITLLEDLGLDTEPIRIVGITQDEVLLDLCGYKLRCLYPKPDYYLVEGGFRSEGGARAWADDMTPFVWMGRPNYTNNFAIKIETTRKYLGRTFFGRPRYSYTAHLLIEHEPEVLNDNYMKIKSLVDLEAA